MDTARTDLTCRVGDDVMGSDDHKIGKLVAFDAHFLTVEHGLINKGEYFVPTSAVNACADGKVYLNVSKDEATHAGWDTPPALTTDAGTPPLLQP
jgi:hypothetical protein